MMWVKEMQVSILTMKEPVYVNPDRVNQLVRQSGQEAAHDILARAVEETALRLGHLANRLETASADELCRCARSLLGISDQIGLDTLTMVAEDVATCIENNDPIATAATTARLLRIGERSLSEICELQGLTR